MKPDKGMQHFKSLYEAAIEVVADLLAETEVFDGPPSEDKRRKMAKQMIKEYKEKGYCSR